MSKCGANMACMCDALGDTCPICLTRWSEQALRDAIQEGYTQPYEATWRSQPSPRVRNLTAQEIHALSDAELQAHAEPLSNSVPWVRVVRDNRGCVCMRRDANWDDTWIIQNPETDFSWLFQRRV